MKNLKKVLSMLLVLVMCLSLLTACGSGDKVDETDKGSNVESNGNNSAGGTDSNTDTNNDDTGVTETSLPAMTTENITLTYCSWENETLTTYLAEKFMEKYPNITVEVVTLSLDGYNDSLLNLVATGQMPDAFWILGECDFAISNELLGDMTEYWENDPEARNVLPTIDEFKFGYYGTDKKWATPVKFFPEVIYANMNAFEALNVEMPSPDFTWEELIDSIKTMTVPEQGRYGFNMYRTIVTWYPIIASDNAWGEFGWNGSEFDMSLWADGMNLQAELKNGGYHAPDFGSEEAAAAFGDANVWAAYTGKIAYQFDAWWTFNNLFATQEYLDLGLVYVPYMIPRANGTTSKNTMGTLDMGGISSSTEHPREAYELLKFMNWNEEGWLNKIEAYRTLTNADGSQLTMDALPVTMSEKVWSEARTFFPGDDDEYGRGKYFDAVWELCRNPIPYGGTVIPGFQTFIAESYAGAELSVMEGTNAHDIAADLSEKANAANKAAMELFGN